MTKLEELIQCIRNECVYVQMHNFPDQDALASAMGLKVLLEAKGKKALIVYYGCIDRDNTLKMIDMLGIDVHLVHEVNMVPEDEIIIVDGQTGNSNVNNFTGNKIACIDHHKVWATDIYRFHDIRENVGACSSIIACYFLENDIPIPKNIATALLYGIKIDTAQMSRRVSELDLAMFYHVYRIADVTILKILDNSNLKREDLEAYRQVINNLRIEKSVGIANAGNDCSEGILGALSDFLLTVSEVEFSLVYSRRGGGIKFSVRSERKDADASHIIKEALKGFGDGGGHADMAAGFVPDIADDGKAKEIEESVEKRVLLLAGKLE